MVGWGRDAAQRSRAASSGALLNVMHVPLGIDLAAIIQQHAIDDAHPYTSEPPTEEGAYWWRDGPGDDDPRVIELFRDASKGELLESVDHDVFPPARTYGEWSGPLEPPE